MYGFGLPMLLAVAVLAATYAITHRVARHRRANPRTPPGQPERMLMPSSAEVGGFATAGLGVVLFLWSHWHGNHMGSLVTLALVIAGIAIVVHSQNWYAIVGVDHVEWRDVSGRVHTLWFDEIAGYRRWSRYGQTYVSVWSDDGRKFSASQSQFDLGPLIDAIEYHRFYGVWPVRGKDPAPPRRHGDSTA